ncbi:MAG: mechanosensitive ion channel [Desulfofustis sp.]|nr:mechanosensitive ion channel [Desulfofustis sp.]
MRTVLLGIVLLTTTVLTAMPATGAKVPAHPAAGQSAADAEVAAEAAAPPPAIAKPVPMARWLHLLDADKETSGTSILSYAPQVTGEFARILESTSDGQKGMGFLGVLLRSLIAIGAGWLIVRGLLFILSKRLSSFSSMVPPEQGRSNARLWAKLLQILPRLIGLLFFGAAAILVFLLLAGNIGVKGRMFFQMLLGIIVIFRFCALIGRVVLSPDDPELRVLKLDESLVKPLYRAFYVSISVLLSGKLIVKLFQELGATPQSVAWVAIILGSAVIMFYMYLVYTLKQPVADALTRQLKETGGSWLKMQMSARWHGFALGYLLLVWFFWIGQLLTGAGGQKGTFMGSMLIIPLFFALKYSGRLLINATIDALNLGFIPDDEFPEGTDETVKTKEREQMKRNIGNRVSATFTIVLTLVLLTWFLSLWGIRIPYATEALRAVFESLVVLAVALIGWRFADRYISNKLAELEPEAEATEEDFDDEFGGAAPRGRSRTLLPMLRKVIGTVLVLMVALTTLSAFGVNIAPLLAGAGVVGLAVGFGAQKLVHDMLSGFFFLLDDAFRVGEYIQAGSIRGTVEAITLRNVMLRHHLGMLQVVPHSDLGAVTNYMRGGIVIKFPLEFPYDTDIDKVRRIIKKVGAAMMEDEELGDDFIQPLKSQGVYEIANSVMVIRVKFTAKPGKQFVIKREAFRRLTEALNAKGIYYAHRKIIVDFPESAKLDSLSPEARQKVLEAGGAAALAADAEEQQKKQEGKEADPMQG